MGLASKYNVNNNIEALASAGLNHNGHQYKVNV